MGARTECTFGLNEVDSSLCALTNIAKAYTLYATNPNDPPTVKVYLDGIGTAPGRRNFLLGLALDVGLTSSYSKVMRACRQHIIEQIREQLNERLPPLRVIDRIEFDVFGFSRGASAARQFVNLIHRRTQHPLAKAVIRERALRLRDGFDWSNPEECRIRFVGLFDTVCASPFEKRHVTLSPDCAERVVHLVAGDEWRHFFSLTRISEDEEGKHISPHFTEVILPGAHSDIGGGYYSRDDFYHSDPHPALSEGKVINRFISIETRKTRLTASLAYRQAMEYAHHKVAQGWANGIAVLPSSDSPPLLGKVNLLIARKYRPTLTRPYAWEVRVEVLLYRVVEGEFSRIPLRIMIEAARAVGVPFNPWDEKTSLLALHSPPEGVNTPTLPTLATRWQFAAVKAGVVRDMRHELLGETYRQLRYAYLHHSADTSFVNGPHCREGLELRHHLGNRDCVEKT
ncbi:phospholipase effector Tle1 domain-containing protein [Aeromonas salmonicida]|uniref:phospholipase effector Tle1 domain-containing protein n=1 Tax=Aeromonas salmonicida TaxID=645 RepID=UPI003520B43B